MTTTPPSGDEKLIAENKRLILRQELEERRPGNAEPTSVPHASVEMRQRLSKLLSSAPENSEPPELTPDEQEAESRRLSGNAFRAAGIPPRAREALGLLVPRESKHPWWVAYDHIEAQIGNGFIFALVGGYGSGKTVMTAALLWQACLKGRQQPKYTTASEMFRKLRSCFKDDGPTEEGVMVLYRTPGLLIIDEAHERGHSPYEDNRLREIIDVRYQWSKDTLLVSNLSPEVFVETLGPAVIDRINQCGEIIPCIWPSFRRTDQRKTK